MKTRTLALIATRTRHRGFTFVELLVGLGLSTLLALVAGFLTVYGARTYVALGNYVDLDEQSRNAVDVIGREIRNSTSVVGFQTNLPVLSLTLTNSTAGTGVTLTYNSNLRTLVMAKTGQALVTNLTQCDQWNFALFDRAPNTNSFSTNITFYPSTNGSGQIDPTFAKLVNMSWKCSRTILGAKLTTESVQTAQIVLRNKVK